MIQTICDDGLRRLAVALMLLALAPGCVGAVVSRSELPEAPIALVYWDGEDGRRRLEMQGEDVDAKTPSVYRAGVAELGRANKLFDNEGPLSADARYPGRLVLLNPRTLDFERVEQAPPGSRPLAWSSDHRRLLFMTARLSGKHQVYSLDVETGEVRLAVGGTNTHFAGDFDAEQGVALARVDQERNGEIVPSIVVSDHGEHPHPVVEHVATRHVGFAPDGSFVVYVPRSFGDQEIAGRPMIMLQKIPVEEEPTALAPGEHPVITRDGEWIVYSVTVGRGAEESSRLRRIRPDGSGRTYLGKSVRSEESPAVSPDGRFVAYVSRHNGLDRLFVKRFEGEGDRLLFDEGAVAHPVW